MSRMVRESQTSGLRERHWFAQSLLKQLRQQQGEGAPRGGLLALRGAVLFHLYSALVGAVRQASATDLDDRLSLSVLNDTLADSERPELAILRSALNDPADVIHWLHREINAACGAAGLAHRPTPRSEDAGLTFAVEDPNLPLAEGDLARLDAAVKRVGVLLQEMAAYTEEW